MYMPAKDTLEDLVDSSDIELPTMPEQIYVLSDNIPVSEDNPTGSKVDRDLLDKLQGKQQCHYTPPPSLILREVMGKYREGKVRGTKGDIVKAEGRR